jgi:hypothetical protein
VARPYTAAVEQIKQTAPGLIFIAVDRPAKEGFALFSEIRREVKKTPIVLVTATLPAEELNLHAKLKVHADAYLDKRTLTAKELLSCLDGLLALKLTPSELSVPQALPAAGGVPRVSQDPPATSRGGASEDSLPRAEPAQPPRAPSRITPFKAGTALGRRQPESPADDNSRAPARRIKREHEIEAKGPESVPGDVAPEPGLAVPERQREVQEPEEPLPSSRQELRRLQEEARRLRRENLAVTMQVEACLEQERQLHRETCKRYESELAFLTRHAEEERARLEREHAARIEALEKKWSEERASLVSTHRAEVQHLGRDHQKTLDALRQQVAVLEALAAAAAAQGPTEAELAEAVASARRAALTESEERRVSELAAAEQRHRGELELQQEAWRLERTKAEQRERAALDQLRTVEAERLRWQDSLRQAEQAHRAALSVLRAEHESALQALRDEHAESLQRRNAEAYEAERRLKDSLERGLRADLEEAHRERESALGLLREEHERHLAALQTEHQRLVASKEEALVILSGMLKSREVHWGKQLDQLQEDYHRQLQAQQEETDRRIAQLVNEQEQALDATREESEARLVSGLGAGIRLAVPDGSPEADANRLLRELEIERRKVGQYESEIAALESIVASLKELIARLGQAESIASLREVIQNYLPPEASRQIAVGLSTNALPESPSTKQPAKADT